MLSRGLVRFEVEENQIFVRLLRIYSLQKATVCFAVHEFLAGGALGGSTDMLVLGAVPSTYHLAAFPTLVDLKTTNKK